MATDSSVFQANLNAAIKQALKDDPEINGLVHASYDNQDLGIKEDDLPVHA